MAVPCPCLPPKLPPQGTQPSSPPSCGPPVRPSGGFQLCPSSTLALLHDPSPTCGSREPHGQGVRAGGELHPGLRLGSWGWDGAELGSTPCMPLLMEPVQLGSDLAPAPCHHHPATPPCDPGLARPSHS